MGWDTTLNKNMQKYSVAIIGSGPAGLTAALQLKRMGISACLFESSHLGGLLYNANLVENYPGFPRGVSGVKLVNLFVKQIEHIGVDVLSERVISVEYDGENFIIKTEKDEYLTEIVVVASGTKARQFDDALIDSGVKKYVFYEVRELLDVAERKIIIVGAGDAAFDYALNLARDNNIVILNRGTQVRALGLLQERVEKNEKIVYLENAQVKQVAVSAAESLAVEVIHQGNVEIMEASYLLGALGRIPNLDFLREGVLSEEKEFVARGTLYFIGDVRNGIFRQTAIAAGDGLRAAMRIEKILKEKV